MDYTRIAFLDCLWEWDKNNNEQATMQIPIFPQLSPANLENSKKIAKRG